MDLTEAQETLLRAYSVNMLPSAVSEGIITDNDYDVLLRYELIRDRTDQRTDLNWNPPRFTLYEITEKGLERMKNKAVTFNG